MSSAQDQRSTLTYRGYPDGRLQKGPKAGGWPTKQALQYQKRAGWGKVVVAHVGEADSGALDELCPSGIVRSSIRRTTCS